MTLLSLIICIIVTSNKAYAISYEKHNGQYFRGKQEISIYDYYYHFYSKSDATLKEMNIPIIKDYKDVIPYTDASLLKGGKHTLTFAYDKETFEYEKFLDDLREYYIESIEQNYAATLHYSNKVVGYYYEKVGFIELEIESNMTEEQSKIVDKKTDELVKEINATCSTDYEKIKAIFNWLVENVTYDKSLKNRSTYNTIVDKNVVCSGYASTMVYVLNKLGIDSKYMICKTSGRLHARVLVLLDDEWYECDPTWAAGYDKIERMKYFMMGKDKGICNPTAKTYYKTSEFNKDEVLANLLVRDDTMERIYKEHFYELLFASFLFGILIIEIIHFTYRLFKNVLFKKKTKTV